MDICDKAQAREQRFTHAALKNQLANRAQEPPQNRAGSFVLCIDCDGAIEPQRLHAKPNAARCIECQQDHEKRTRR